MLIESGIAFLWGLIGLTTKAVVALLILFKMLNYANDSQGVKLKDVLEKLREDPRALGDYYSRRLIAAAIVVLGVSIGSM
jgi:hypothetical protein